jgi:hypothetical protein
MSLDHRLFKTLSGPALTPAERVTLAKQNPVKCEELLKEIAATPLENIPNEYLALVIEGMKNCLSGKAKSFDAGFYLAGKAGRKRVRTDFAVALFYHRALKEYGKHEAAAAATAKHFGITSINAGHIYSASKKCKSKVAEILGFEKPSHDYLNDYL